mgnify:CR=1 FL=1
MNKNTMNKKRASRSVPLLKRGLTVCLLFLTVGCGSKGTISGTVTYKGTPLAAGSVVFVPGKEGPSITAPIIDGKYTVEKVPVGSAKIAVMSISTEGTDSFMTQIMTGGKGGPPKDAPMPEEARKLFEGGGGQTKKGVKIPEQYNDPEKSGLTYTVESGNQTHDIPLK